MRGGALPLLFWACLLLAAAVLNAVWTHDAIQTGTFAAALGVVVCTALALIAHSPEAARRGEPTQRCEPQAFPHASIATVTVAVGFGVLLFGFAFGHFPIYFGAGMIVVGLCRLALELRAQRRALRLATQTRHEEEST